MNNLNDKTEYVSDLLLDAYESRVSDVPRSIEMTETALRLSKEINHKGYTAKSYSHLSLFNMIQGQYDESLRFAELSMSIYSDLDDERGMADAMYNIAGIYYKTNNFHSGLIYLVDCLAIYKKHGDFHNQARAEKSIGTIYEYFGDTSSAIESYQRAIEYGEKANDKNLQSNAYNPLSGIYLNRNQIDKAMKIISQSIQLKKETGDIRGLAFALYGRGKVYVKQGKYDEALADYQNSLDIHVKMGEKLGWGMVLYKMGALFHLLKEYDKARERLNEALDYSTKSKTAFIKYKAYYHLYLIAKEQNLQDEALGYLEKYLFEKENVINAQTHKIIEAYRVIADKQNLELEAKTQREKAEIIEKKNNELDAFFYKVSHDLKAPISSIIGLDAVVRERIKDDEALGYFDIYKKQVERINTMLDELMRMARVDYHIEPPQKIEFCKIIDDCKSSFTYLPNFEKVSFQIDLANNLNYLSSWSLVNSIIQNLIENGIKYADLEKEESLVSFKISTHDDVLLIIYQDNGIGMNSETKDRAFDMFFKENQKSEGSGLGLYILSRAVEKLKGKVHIESKKGEGSTFKVVLPYQ